MVIDASNLVKIGSQGVSKKVVQNDNPAANLPMMLENYQPGTTTCEKIKHHGEEIGTLLDGEIVLAINGQSYCLSAGQLPSEANAITQTTAARCAPGGIAAPFASSTGLHLS